MRMARGGKDRPLVVLQDLQPSGHVRRVIVPDLRDKLKIGAQEGRTKLGDKLFHRVTLIAKALAPEIAVAPAR